MLAAALALAALAAQPASAQPAAAQESPRSSLYGVWLGTVGKYDIMACFDDSSDRAGVYYYRSQLKPIMLLPDDDVPVLAEATGFDSPNGATWSVRRKGPNAIAGYWQGTINGKASKLPIRLTPVAAAEPEYAEPCESDAFMAPRMEGSSVEELPDEFDGMPITRLNWKPGKAFNPETAAMSTFALGATRPGDAAINAELRKILPDGSPTSDFAQCMSSMIALRGWDGDYSNRIEPELITADYVAINNSVGLYCGGAHPSYWDHRQVFDRATGAEIDPSIWLSPEALTFVEPEYQSENAAKRTVTGLAPGLMALVRANWEEPELAECLAEDGMIFGWDLGLQGGGLVFKPEVPHVATVCAVPVTVSWDQLAPFLSESGAALAASLR